ncbi:MAG: NYN domain-containing protein [Fibrobacteraceae bacterium]
MSQERMQPPFPVGLFIDGFTFRKVNEYYRIHHTRHTCIDFTGFRHWVKEEALKVFHPRGLIELEAHYYHPFGNPRHSGDLGHAGTLQLERKLKIAGIQMHYNAGNAESVSKPNSDLMDDALIFAAYHKIKAVVLVTTQGQFAELPLDLRRLGVSTLLLGWNFEYPGPGTDYTIRWHTDSKLKERAAHYIAMDRIMGEEKKQPPDASVESLFLSSRWKMRRCYYGG